jgi:hypothetical protein
MRMLTIVALAVLIGGCAAASSTPAGTQTFAGEVWTWDVKESTVTLWQDGRPVRVKTTPEQIRTLQLHQFARVTGTPAAPADLLLVRPATPVTAVPKGQPDVVELKGTVAAVDPGGRLAINSDRGPIHVWAAAGADQRFAPGTAVVVKSSVQAVDLVSGAASAPTPTPTPVGSPAASPSSEAGDHAVVIGRIMGINPGGMLVVESPSGPIQVLAADSTRYKVGDAVQVRTTVRPAS